MKQYRILVIEDNELNMKLVHSVLERAGYRILEAVDAETGIQMAKDHLPDLILMDIQLSGIDGLAATRLLKQARPPVAQIPIIALTSYAMEGDEQKAYDAGCSGYITKPINTRRFCRILERYLHPQQGTEGP